VENFVSQLIGSSANEDQNNNEYDKEENPHDTLDSPEGDPVSQSVLLSF
jgi:hypothetical protein